MECDLFNDLLFSANFDLECEMSIRDAVDVFELELVHFLGSVIGNVMLWAGECDASALI